MIKVRDGQVANGPVYVAVGAVIWPEVTVRSCVAHLVRNSLR